jgi:diaminopropionate ammonia-lyase
MREKVEWIANQMKKSDGNRVKIDFLNLEEIGKARKFLMSFPCYKETPLRNLVDLADKMGIAGIYVKDESYRFGLNAFKVLGGSYAIAKYLAQRLNMEINELSFDLLTSKAIKEKLGDITFATATDGNHGRGVAWTARQLCQKSVVYMPKGSSQARLKNIQAEGAEASITELNYDDAVRLAAENATKYGWVMVQDTAWDGYEDIPAWIMQGYGIMAAEALEQLNNLGVDKPTHIFAQAGVGSLAGAIQGYYASAFPQSTPKTVIVEANKAACLYKSIEAGDGQPKMVGGDMQTIMAGLACGEPNTISWEVLRDYSDMFVSCPDWITAKGMRMLGNPMGNDIRVISGESGAVTMGLLSVLMQNDDLKTARECLQLNEDSRVLLFSTEGDTDQEKYRSIVWDGEYPSYE